ncbi:hypothetical protein [Stenotrophomonas maltophilia]|uniref:hypothetical protein n=1 Tax=Stenotrophomonas maltophilia TaxID=40324 RepID=UPI0039C4CBAB
MALLYRGVSKAIDDGNGGRIKPHGSAPKVAVLADGRFLCDGTITLGETFENAARAHRLESGLYGGSVVSFTRDATEAHRFATSNFSEQGVVYVVDEALFEKHGILAWEGEDVEWADEQEVSLSAPDGGDIPPAIVVRKYEVDSQGRHISDLA